MAACKRAKNPGVKETAAELAITQVDKLSNTDLTSRGWRKHWESLRGRRATIMAYIFITHTYYPLKNYYLSRYGSFMKTCNNSLSSAQSVRVDEHSSQLFASRVTGETVGPWRWDNFPKMRRALVWYRIVSTAYMVYVVLKNLNASLLEIPLIYLINPSKPVNCYLLGRYLPGAYARRASAFLFAGYHLVWRYFQLYQPAQNYMISTIYFLMLDDHDIVNYYKLQDDHGARHQHVLTDRMNVNAIPNESYNTLFHNIMSAKIDRCNRISYKLRPNRTPEASRLLRKYLVDSTLIWIAVFVPVALTISIVMCYTCFDTQRYLDDYPDCSQEMQLLHDQGQLGGWDLNQRWHQLLALLFDSIENYILWSECGIAGAFSIPFSMILNYDLMLYWEYLDKKVTIIIEEARKNHFLASSGNIKQSVQNCKSLKLPIIPPTTYHRIRDQDDKIYELQMEWQDFIKQIKHSDAFIGDTVSCYIIIWFTLFAVFVHDTLSAGRSNLPLAANLTLVWVISIVTFHSAALLILHRHCLYSYTKICSLMAYDRSAHQLNFIQMIDYFTSKRTCFTLYRRHKMTATTFLTIVGWSFSCFFILGNVRRG